MSERDHARILIYSHDTFGLGRLRRCLAVANALVGHFKGLFVLIISGAQPPIGSGMRARVDFVKIPSVIKLYDGQYTSMEEHIDLRDTLEIRRTIIRNTAESFDPDLMIVDDKPFGITPEIQGTLEDLKQSGCTLALALPDLIEASADQRGEWKANRTLESIASLYDRIWIYGSEQFARPLETLDAPKSLLRKTIYTGYLQRNLPRGYGNSDPPFTNPYILVTGDDKGHGQDLMNRVLTAYESDPTLPHPALLVLSPLLPPESRKILRGRAVRLANVKILDSDEGSAALIPGAVGIVTTADYESFCQMLSFDKRVIFITEGAAPNAQSLRAERAAELKLAQTLSERDADDPIQMARALHAFPNRPLPSQAGGGDMLGGLETICEEIDSCVKKSETV